MTQLCQQSGIQDKDSDPLVEQLPHPVGGQTFSLTRRNGAVVTMITVGVEMWILEGIKMFVYICDDHEACLFVMDHNVLSSMFLLDNDGSYFKNCRPL